MSEQNIEVVKRGYEAFSLGNVETVMSQFDDNLEWVRPGESTISGTYRGKSDLVGAKGAASLASLTVAFLVE